LIPARRPDLRFRFAWYNCSTVGLGTNQLRVLPRRRPDLVSGLSPTPGLAPPWGNEWGQRVVLDLSGAPHHKPGTCDLPSIFATLLSCSALTVAVCEWQGRNRETLFPATGAVGASLPTLTRSREKLCGMFWSSPALFTLTRFISRRACSALCQLERIDRQPSDSLSRETM